MINKKSVCIISNGYSRQEFSFYQNKGSDIWVWALNAFDYNLVLRKTDAVFELHCDIWDLEGHAWNKIPDMADRIKSARMYRDLLNSLKSKVYMSFKDNGIKNSVLYPFKKIIKKYGIYFDNSVSYMIALAIEKGYNEIKLFGCDFFEERKIYNHGVCEYILGIAKGKGITISIAEGSSLLVPFNTRPFELYGIRKRADIFLKSKKLKKYMDKFEKFTGVKIETW